MVFYYSVRDRTHPVKCLEDVALKDLDQWCLHTQITLQSMRQFFFGALKKIEADQFHRLLLLITTSLKVILFLAATRMP